MPRHAPSTAPTTSAGTGAVASYPTRRARTCQRRRQVGTPDRLAEEGADEPWQVGARAAGTQRAGRGGPQDGLRGPSLRIPARAGSAARSGAQLREAILFPGTEVAAGAIMIGAIAGHAGILASLDRTR